MIEYEVNLDVDTGIVDDYLGWLRLHVAKMLLLPGFTGAALYEAESEDPARRVFCVRYRLADRAALEVYFREHASHMRSDGLSRFGDRFSASRRILRKLPSQTT